MCDECIIKKVKVVSSEGEERGRNWGRGDGALSLEREYQPICLELSAGRITDAAFDVNAKRRMRLSCRESRERETS